MELNKYIGRYLGTDKIVEIKEHNFKTPGGNDTVLITFKNKDKDEIITVKALEVFTSKKALDYTEFRDKKSLIIANDILALIMEYNIKSSDIVHLLKLCGDKMQDAFERASNYLWTRDDNQWIPGISFLQERTILEAENILKKINNENKNE